MRAFNPWVGAAASVAVMLLPFVHWWVPGIVTPSTAWAAIGSIVTVLGIITIGRPVIRVGYEKWLELRAHCGHVERPCCGTA